MILQHRLEQLQSRIPQIAAYGIKNIRDAEDICITLQQAAQAVSCEPMQLAVALNTWRNFKTASDKGCYFNSPDKSYFDGSAEGYWKRLSIELGASDADFLN